MKSNITIRSNVFNKNPNIHIIDRDYNSKIMSISAIQMLDQRMGYNGITSSWMNKKQEEVYFSFPKCVNNEQKFGFIKPMSTG